MTYRQFLQIEKQMAHYISTYLEGTAAEPFTENDSDVISFTVPFAGGMEMDIKVCGTDVCTAYCEAVLFTKKGAEVCCSEPMDELIGEWSLDYNGNTYSVVVVVGERRKIFAMPTVYGPNGTTPLAPSELAAHANTVHHFSGGKGSPFTANDFSGESQKCRLQGNLCNCGTIDGTPNGMTLGHFELLPVCDQTVREGGKAYMFCRTCRQWSHL